MSTLTEPPSVPALYSFLLGTIVSGSLIIAFLRHEMSPHMTPFASYLGSLALFHFLEYYWQAKYHPSTTTSEGKDSWKLFPFIFSLAFLLNHSKEYLMAIIAGVLEYSVKRLLNLSPVFLCFQLIGLTMVAFGILIRSIAMITAASNFSHNIWKDLSDGHKLVTEGVYSFCRHPSYLGFFAFAVGGQVILGNYISSAIFIFILQKFFRERIVYEESILLKTYPKEYADYKKKTWSGIPFNSD